MLGAFLILASFSMAGWALKERFDQTNARREQQQAFNQRIEQLSLESCREIEDLKRARRQQALEAYRDRGRTMRLLRLEPTPELERAFLQSRDTVLERFQAKPCPRPQEGSLGDGE
jgi:hypothetical protein